MLYRLARLFGQNPDIISFAGGAPDPNLYPATELAAAAAETMTQNPRALSYGRDVPALKEQVVALMGRRGINCTAENISITAGGQHAMDILTRLFLNPCGEVMLEELVYTGIQQAVMPFQPSILTIPLDPETGLDLNTIIEHLESGARPAFLYTIPEAHNPAGVTLSLEKRQRLVELARSYRLPIVEDDAYGFLGYDESNNVPLKALDEEWVIYLGTFSKILAPGLRLGWVISPPSLTNKVQVMKRLSMLSVAPLSQHIAAAYMTGNDFWSHIEAVRRQYGRRRDAMLQSMEEHFPSSAHWTKPLGGMFIWARLPDGVDTEEIVFQAVEEEGVAFIPGKAFVTDPDNRRFDNYLRLSFARYEPERLEEGIARLGRILKKTMPSRARSRG
jgi:2-aminoadipate transaminase